MLVYMKFKKENGFHIWSLKKHSVSLEIGFETSQLCFFPDVDVVIPQRSALAKLYWPSQVGPQQRSSCPVQFMPTERDGVQFRNKGKLNFLISSLIREQRDVNSGSGILALPTDCGWSCFLGLCPLGGAGRWEEEEAGLHCSGSRQGFRAQAPPPPSWAECVPELRGWQPFGTRSSGLKCQLYGLCTWQPMSKWD